MIVTHILCDQYCWCRGIPRENAKKRSCYSWQTLYSNVDDDNSKQNDDNSNGNDDNNDDGDNDNDNDNESDDDDDDDTT